MPCLAVKLMWNQLLLGKVMRMYLFVRMLLSIKLDKKFNRWTITSQYQKYTNSVRCIWCMDGAETYQNIGPKIHQVWTRTTSRYCRWVSLLVVYPWAHRTLIGTGMVCASNPKLLRQKHTSRWHHLQTRCSLQKEKKQPAAVQILIFEWLLVGIWKWNEYTTIADWIGTEREYQAIAASISKQQEEGLHLISCWFPYYYSTTFWWVSAHSP